MKEPQLKTFKVATFYEPRKDRAPLAAHIRAYTRMYNPAWEGCVLYTVEAINGADAKYTAIQMRLGKELAHTVTRTF